MKVCASNAFVTAADQLQTHFFFPVSLPTVASVWLAEQNTSPPILWCHSIAPAYICSDKSFNQLT